MDPAVVVLLAIIVAGIPLIARAFSQVNKKCDKVNNRITIIQTMLIIYLEHAGFDSQKVARALNEHMNEAGPDGGPIIGCINIKELYRDKE